MPYSSLSRIPEMGEKRPFQELQHVRRLTISREDAEFSQLTISGEIMDFIRLNSRCLLRFTAGSEQLPGYLHTVPGHLRDEKSVSPICPDVKCFLQAGL